MSTFTQSDLRQLLYIDLASQEEPPISTAAEHRLMRIVESAKLDVVRIDGQSVLRVAHDGQVVHYCLALGSFPTLIPIPK